ncbi:hypothetical protein NPIL_693861 [Nephila pilipes]|uniref:Uncharacterized protein n=1 Tax=Nephila pilipes TaxID=299642 RepID=A0A8X6QD00_NEPPI|nr:hypothetical protein NPIL_693861 [Nephila pilipes]
MIVDTGRKTSWDILYENNVHTARARIAGLIDEFLDLWFESDEETNNMIGKFLHKKVEQIQNAEFKIPKIYQNKKDKLKKESLRQCEVQNPDCPPPSIWTMVFRSTLGSR